MTIPSHFSSALTLPRGRRWRSNGATTVGPDSTKIAPSSVAKRPPMSSSQYAAAEPSTHCTSMPTLTKRPTVVPTSRASLSRSVRPPSNRMIATESDTTTCNRSPGSSTSGSIHPNTGPTRNPASSSSRIDGRRTTDASHCAPTPSPTARTACDIRDSFTRRPLSPPEWGASVARTERQTYRGVTATRRCDPSRAAATAASTRSRPSGSAIRSRNGNRVRAKKSIAVRRSSGA